MNNLPPEGPGAGLANPSQGSWKLAIVWVFLEPIEVRKFIHTQKRKKKKTRPLLFVFVVAFAMQGVGSLVVIIIFNLNQCDK